MNLKRSTKPKPFPAAAREAAAILKRLGAPKSAFVKEGGIPARSPSPAR